MSAFSHPYIQHLIRLAQERRARIAIPDAQFDERCLEAAVFVHRQGWLPVVLTGARREIERLGRRHGLDTSGMEIIDPDERPDFAEMCREYGESRARSPEE